MKAKSLVITAIILYSAIVILNSSIAKAEVHVYDNGNQYIGILVDINPARVEVFIPSLSAIGEFDTRDASGCPSTDVYFESIDCTGTPYAYGPHPNIFDLNILLGGFYKPDFSGKKTANFWSRYDRNCQCLPTSGEFEYYPVTIEVQMPFTTPVALPLRFEVRNRAVVIPLN